MTDFSHLDALNFRLSNERIRLTSATGEDRELRAVWVSQCEKEIASEMKFLGIEASPEIEMTDDELLDALLG